MRVKGGPASKRRHKRILRAARGYVGGRGKLFRTAADAVDRSGAYAYRDRRQKKRAFRRLWIARINAGARREGMSYSRLISGLQRHSVELNRKVLADLAVRDQAAFAQLCALAQR